jgi:anti-sigma28 factor (negative regulator of flagellin synthesis)
MGQINTIKLPEYLPDTQLAGTKLTSGETDGSAPPLETSAPQDDFQLTRLSSVLTSLKNGASAVRAQVSQVISAVRNGSYEVDPLAVSRSIVGDSLSQH